MLICPATPQEECREEQRIATEAKVAAKAQLQHAMMRVAELSAAAGISPELAPVTEAEAKVRATGPVLQCTKHGPLKRHTRHGSGRTMSFWFASDRVQMSLQLRQIMHSTADRQYRDVSQPSYSCAISTVKHTHILSSLNSNVHSILTASTLCADHPRPLDTHL